ncbi:MAG: DUF928 domain-containing protein [Stigonema ocellatum SAG 48.90 = DSM 106950]|nr:DUF928 domain-containing protein [Stigonema ocellatum SAG 48.90 = DSM 106950]
MSSMNIIPDARANHAPPRLATVKFNPPPPPPNRGAPGNRGEGGSRGCGVGNQSLKALMPVYEETFSQNQKESIYTTQVWGLTSFENPTFWFYVPYSSSSIKVTEFVLQNEKKKTIYRTPVTIPETPGIVSFRLPSTSAALELDKNYHWFFKLRVITCDSQQPRDLDYVEGWVQRTHLNGQLGDRLKQATPELRVALYAENGLWYDALSALAELRLANSKDTNLTAGWTSLLRSVGLENLANKPLVKCCDPQS